MLARLLALEGAAGLWEGGVCFPAAYKDGVGASSRRNTLRVLRVLDWWDRGARAAT